MRLMRISLPAALAGLSLLAPVEGGEESSGLGGIKEGETRTGDRAKQDFWDFHSFSDDQVSLRESGPC